MKKWPEVASGAFWRSNFAPSPSDKLPSDILLTREAALEEREDRLVFTDSDADFSVHDLLFSLSLQAEHLPKQLSF